MIETWQKVSERTAIACRKLNLIYNDINDPMTGMETKNLECVLDMFCFQPHLIYLDMIMLCIGDTEE